MNVRAFFLIVIAWVLLSASARAEGVVFRDLVGKWRIFGTDEFVEITETPEGMHFKIRDCETSDEVHIDKNADWFIAMVDQDHFWAHFGGGKLNYFVWKKVPKNGLHITEYMYPKMSDVELPAQVEERMKKVLAAGNVGVEKE